MPNRISSCAKSEERSIMRTTIAGVVLVVSQTRVVIFLSRLAVQKVGE